MTKLSRREFGRLAGATAVTVAACPGFAIAQAAPKVVVIGGGAAGATAAHYLKKADARLDVALLEPQRIYSTSFFSNLYLGGLRNFASLNHGYGDLRKLGVRIVHELAANIDTGRKTVKTGGGATLAYDRLVVAPGIDIKYESVSGYSKDVSAIWPHAYDTGGAAKLRLKHLLEAMRDGGTFLMVMPNGVYRCPPGPYERACLIAHYFKTRKPRSKLVILDPKKAFSKQAVFMEGIERYYKDQIELNLSNEIDDFSIAHFDASAREATTKAGSKVKFDAANVIPNQRAGAIAITAGLADGDWCKINPENFSSAKAKDVYVLGDASVAAEMPKSAFAANNQAKIVAADIAADLMGKDRFPPRFSNTCWSLIAPDDSVKIGASYAPKDGRLEASNAFVSQRGEAADVRKANFAESADWYDSIIADMFATAPAKSAPRKG